VAVGIRRGQQADLSAASRLLEEQNSLSGVIGLERFGSDALLRLLCPVSAVCMSKVLLPEKDHGGRPNL
jgi:hypothetical protein